MMQGIHSVLAARTAAQAAARLAGTLPGVHTVIAANDLREVLRGHHPDASEGIRRGRHELVAAMRAPNGVTPLTANRLLADAVETLDSVWELVLEQLHPYTPTRVAIQRAMEQLGGRSQTAKKQGLLEFFFPEALSLLERGAILATFRSEFGLSIEDVGVILGGMTLGGEPLRVWTRLSDTAHTSDAADVIRRYLGGNPEQNSGILTSNPRRMFLLQASGMPLHGEYDALVRRWMLQNWDFFRTFSGEAIQYVQNILLLDPELRLAYHRSPRTLSHLNEVARSALQRAVGTIDLWLATNVAFREFFYRHWELEVRRGEDVFRTFPTILAAVGGKSSRFRRLSGVTPEMVSDTVQRIRDLSLPLPEMGEGGIQLQNRLEQNWFLKYLIQQTVMEALLDGLDPQKERGFRRIVSSVLRRLNRFETGRVSPSLFLPSPLYQEGEVPLAVKPREASVDKGLAVLQKYGFQQRDVFELTLATHRRLIRGASYKAVAMEDGRIWVALKVNGAFLHTFFLLKEDVQPGVFDVSTLSFLRDVLSQPLPGVAFEFRVGDDGVLHLSRRSGAYRTEVEWMDVVLRQMEERNFAYVFNRDETF